MNLLDKAIGFFSPGAGFRRVQNRARMLAMEGQIRKYEGAAEGRRHSNWLTRNNPSVNQLIKKDLKNLVARSRELSINNGYARKAPNTIANSVIGTGILPTAVIQDKIENGQIKPVPNKDKLQQMVQAAWKEWADVLTCDYNGDYNFYGLQYLLMRTIVVSGEMLAIRKRVTVDVNKYGFQIQLLEADFIDTTKNNDKDPDGGYTMDGIKYDKNYKRAGYWIYDRHPSETDAVSSFVKIEDIIHVYDVERAGQARGVPSASSTILKQRDLDDYEDAELLGKKASACLPIFITNADPEGENTEDKIEAIEPGAINYLNPGESVSSFAPAPNPGFAEFTKTQHRAIAAGYLMTYEMYTGDLSNVNFSSGRMGWLEFQRQVTNWQYLMLIPRFCDKVFQWFVESLAIAQSFDKTIKVTAYWTAPRREMIDPTKETGAKRTAMRSGLQSWSETVRQDGYNPEEVLKEMAADQNKFIQAGLMPDWTPFFELMAAAKQNASAENTDTPTEKK
jgi:lambda family phage portal protein